jgi:proteasome lid subunit RPN8/RPN11
VKHEVIAAMLTHARDAAPDECCGLLLGTADDIVQAVPARNIATEPTSRFLVDPEDHFAARRTARARGMALVGFYHSHPRSAAEPSARDLAEFSYAGYFYAIVSLKADPPEVNLFRYEAGAFERVQSVRSA